MRKEGIKRFSRHSAIGFVIALVLFCTIAHAAPPADIWNQFYTKDKECSIAFPAQPTLVQKSLQVANGKELHYDIYLAPFQEKGVCMLLVATYPYPLSGGHEIAGLEGLLRGIIGQNSENQLIFANLIDYGGRPAMNFLVQSLSNYFRGHAHMLGNKLYLIAMEGRKSELDEKMFDQFLDSFKVEK